MLKEKLSQINGNLRKKKELHFLLYHTSMITPGLLPTDFNDFLVFSVVQLDSTTFFENLINVFLLIDSKIHVTFQIYFGKFVLRLKILSIFFI